VVFFVALRIVFAEGMQDPLHLVGTFRILSRASRAVSRVTEQSVEYAELLLRALVVVPRGIRASPVVHYAFWEVCRYRQGDTLSKCRKWAVWHVCVGGQFETVTWGANTEGSKQHKRKISIRLTVAIDMNVTGCQARPGLFWHLTSGGDRRSAGVSNDALI
jgi:hypothetical protein